MDYLNGKNIKRAVAINDMSCFGKCSLTVALPIISHYGVEVVPLPTALLSNHTGGFKSYYCLDLTENMEKIIAEWESLGLEFDCIYTGYFSDPKQIDITLKFIEKFKRDDTILVVDPVMGDNGTIYKGLNEGFVNGIAKLCENADIITPNLTEASLLTGLSIDTDPYEMLKALNTENAIITGVINGEKIGCYAKFGSKFSKIEKPYVNRMLHGCGDVFTSIICGELLTGVDMKRATENAMEFCEKCIKATDGDYPYHKYGLKFETLLNGFEK